MKYRKSMLVIMILILILLMFNVTACGFFDSSSWKEEVLLHDGSKIIVKRWQKHSGPRSFGAPIREALISEQTISFKHPKTNKTIIWKDGPTEDIDIANFNLLALHIKDDTPYLITTTKKCIEYNKWGRPNPPYVVFKYEGKEWKHIPLSELPVEFKNVNLVIDPLGDDEELLNGSLSPITAEKIKEFNRSLKGEIYKTIIRNPLPLTSAMVTCPEMIYLGRAGWMDIRNFTARGTYEKCLSECKLYLQDNEFKKCPCEKLFMKNIKGE